MLSILRVEKSYLDHIQVLLKTFFLHQTTISTMHISQVDCQWCHEQGISLAILQQNNIIINGFSKGPNRLTNIFLLMDMYILIIGSTWMTCVCLISKLDISDLFTYMSNWTSGQVGQSKMTSLVKMDNDVIVKWDILCYLIG